MCKQQVIKFQTPTPEIDVWATAACLYYLLTGHSPRDFRGKENPLAFKNALRTVVQSL
jgi:eukaryotic-like serine/threonine-protein kinase